MVFLRYFGGFWGFHGRGGNLFSRTFSGIFALFWHRGSRLRGNDGGGLSLTFPRQEGILRQAQDERNCHSPPSRFPPSRERRGGPSPAFPRQGGILRQAQDERNCHSPPSRFPPLRERRGGPSLAFPRPSTGSGCTELSFTPIEVPAFAGTTGSLEHIFRI